MRSEPGPGSELGRQLSVAWETTEEESCSTGLQGYPGADGWWSQRRLSGGYSIYMPYWGLPLTLEAGRKTEVQSGVVERLTHCHTEGQWPGTEDRAGPASQPWLCHLLELNPGTHARGRVGT